METDKKEINVKPLVFCKVLVPNDKFKLEFTNPGFFTYVEVSIHKIPEINLTEKDLSSL